MRIKRMHTSIYSLYRYARTQESLDVYRKKCQEKIACYEKLKNAGTKENLIPSVGGISRATYYRAKKRLKELEHGILPPSKKPKRVNKPQWTEADKQLVLKIRRENPTYGKSKIRAILVRDHGWTLSESTVGRILTHLKEQGLITKSPSALRTKRKRNFQKGHAQPWTFKKYQDMQLGERIQIDHMTVTKNGIVVKHFQAWERKSKYLYVDVFSRANSSCAKRFLMDFLEQAPFPIKSIQVDGGSEFMAHFQDACQELRIPLIVLPPRKPQYNGGVERGNRTFREEFYNTSTLLADSVGAMRAELRKAMHKYNTYRPHFNLQNRTPMQYIQEVNHDTFQVAA